MTNLEAMTDHNIFGSRFERSARRSTADIAASRRSEGGYTLVAMLALMTVLALFAMAIAPRVRQQAQREREREAIYRGEQVADAIRQYYAYRTNVLRIPGDQALPSSMEQLLEGLPVVGGSKNRMILRASAARDPLTIEGEWRFVGPRTQSLIEFEQSILFYTNSFLPPPHYPEMISLQQLAVPTVINTINLKDRDKSSGSSSVDDFSGGPFVGVASRSRNASVLTFYGIERHDQWIFTPLFR
jgi:type II secretory pathway pseudopilin PulG